MRHLLVFYGDAGGPWTMLRLLLLLLLLPAATCL
jgi:hypothetical protein